MVISSTGEDISTKERPQSAKPDTETNAIIKWPASDDDLVIRSKSIGQRPTSGYTGIPDRKLPGVNISTPPKPNQPVMEIQGSTSESLESPSVSLGSSSIGSPESGFTSSQLNIVESATNDNESIINTIACRGTDRYGEEPSASENKLSGDESNCTDLNFSEPLTINVITTRLEVYDEKNDVRPLVSPGLGLNYPDSKPNSPLDYASSAALPLPRTYGLSSPVSDFTCPESDVTSPECDAVSPGLDRLCTSRLSDSLSSPEATTGSGDDQLFADGRGRGGGDPSENRMERASRTFRRQKANSEGNDHVVVGGESLVNLRGELLDNSQLESSKRLGKI